VELVVAAVWYEPQILMLCRPGQARILSSAGGGEVQRVADWYSPTEIAFFF